MGANNPRYPHWCRIIRKTVNDPMEDEDDFDPMEGEKPVGQNQDDYDPMGSDDDMPIDANEQQQSEESSSEDSSSSEESDENSQTTLIYEGECRSYKINTTSDKGEIVSSERGLALPLNQDAWDALGTVPLEGDEIVVLHGSTFKEYGRVLDKTVATADYAGTHLTWRYGRN